MSGNAGVETGKVFLRIIWWIIRLLPSLFRGIFNGGKKLLNAVNKKQDPVQQDIHLQLKPDFQCRIIFQYYDTIFASDFQALRLTVKKLPILWMSLLKKVHLKSRIGGVNRCIHYAVAAFGCKNVCMIRFQECSGICGYRCVDYSVVQVKIMFKKIMIGVIQYAFCVGLCVSKLYLKVIRIQASCR